MNRVEKEILQERQRFAGQVFALAASLVLFVLAIAQGLIYFASLRAAAPGHGMGAPALLQAWWQIMAIGLLALLGAGWKTYQAWKDSARRVGQLMDEKFAASKNRLEASAELSQSSDPLALAQRQETADYLDRNPTRRRSHVLALTTACGAMLLIVNGELATKCIGALQSAQTLAQAKKPDLPQAPVREPYAKIDVVAPESETRATPIEEVVVKGRADSDNGFSAVSLHASINGGDEKSIPIDPTQFNKGGETKFDQSLLLDELGAQPYDVVSYYLQGISRHATPLTVASQMQFIEVRPFREDVHKMKAGNGDSQDFAKLTWLISQQIIISKRTWILATNQLPPNNPAVVAETGKSGDAQDKIAAKTRELYQQMTEQGLPASIIDHISQAETSMHQAVDEIKKPALLAANPIQRHALGELVEATKNFIRVTADNPAQGSNPNAVNDPFKDRQKLPSPTGPAATNPIAKLDKLIKREQDIVKDLASTSSDAKTPDDSANPSQNAAPKGDQSAPNQPDPNADQSSTPSPGSPAPSPGSSEPQPAQNPAPGGQPSETASNSPAPGGQPSPGQSGSPLADEQSQIGKDLGDLQNQPETPASSNSAMSEAQEAAQRSADKLSAQDQAGALNDARTADAAMLRAEAAMETEAARQMRDALAQTQQQLHEAAQAQLKATNPADQAKVNDQAALARANLAQEKDQQTASGDQKLAQLADALAHDYDQSGIPDKLARLTTAANVKPEDRAAMANQLNKFADQIAARRLAMQTETQNLEDTLKRIDRVRDNMNSAHGTPEQQAQLAKELAADLNTAVSDANVLLPHDDQPHQGTGKSSAENADGAQENGTPHTYERPYVNVPIHPISPMAFQGLREPLTAFREEIEQRLAFLRDQGVLTYLNPDQSPEQYRAQVAAYYERISREAKAAVPNPPAQPASP